MVAYYVLYDLMMVVDKYGKVVANNTSDKNGIPIKTDFLIGKDFSNEEWFRLCMSPQGPPGGAWYSDFMENQLVGQIYQSKGQGMAFTAPIKDDAGQIIGVWYNYASWRDVTQGIRAETEQLLQKTEPDAFELITDKNGKVIDSEDGDLILNLTITPELVKQEGFSFQFKGRTIAAVDHVFGFGQARGAYIYKGNNWWGVTVVPKMKFSFSLFFSELLVFTTAVLGILILGIFVFMRLSKSISKKVQALQQVVNSLSQGELAEINFDASKDEIGQMTNAVKTLINGLKKTSAFANEIGQGNLDAEFEALSGKDMLGHSLITMRENLQKIKIEEEKRNWVTQGLAEFGDKLRKSNNNDIALLSDDILVFLCNYLSANQAAIFIEEQEGQKIYLQMIACYAWERKKYGSMRIEKGEGLIGQAWQEGGTISLTEVPEDFVKITSGLGYSNPKNILILPLKNSDEVLGILEIASFKKFEPQEIEFFQKVSESMGSTLASVKINERTKKLLEQTQQQAEAMRSQEEEMRQNLEEMQSTQEGFQRREKDYLEQLDKCKENGKVSVM